MGKTQESLASMMEQTKNNPYEMHPEPSPLKKAFSPGENALPLIHPSAMREGHFSHAL